MSIQPNLSILVERVVLTLKLVNHPVAKGFVQFKVPVTPLLLIAFADRMLFKPHRSEGSLQFWSMAQPASAMLEYMDRHDFWNDKANEANSFVRSVLLDSTFLCCPYSVPGMKKDAILIHAYVSRTHLPSGPFGARR